MVLQRVQKQRTLADVRKSNGTEAREKAVKKMNEATKNADREAIAHALSNPSDKSVRENLLDLKQKVDRSGTSKQRREFGRIFQGELKGNKEVLDWALNVSKNSGDLVSIKKEIDAFGTKEQKEKWAKLYEQYNPVKQEPNFLTRQAVSQVQQFEGQLDPIKPANTPAQHAAIQAEYDAMAEKLPQQKTPESEAAVSKVKEQLSKGTDYKAASETHVYKPVTPTQSRVKAADLEAAFGGKVEHVPQTSSYVGNNTPKVDKPTNRTAQILKDLAERREADYNNPAKDLAKSVLNPTKKRLIPEVDVKPLTEGEIFQAGVDEGMKKAGKTVHNHNNFYTAFITEVNENVGKTIDDKFKEFSKQQESTFNKFNDIAKKMNETTSKMEKAVGRVENAAGKVEGAAAKVDNAAGRIQGAAGKIEGAAASIQNSATKISDAAGKFEAMTNEIKQALEAGQKAQRTLGNLKKGGIVLAALGGVVLAGTALSKLFSSCDNDRKAKTPAQPDAQPTPAKQDKTSQTVVPMVLETSGKDKNPEREYVFGDGSSLGFDTNFDLGNFEVRMKDSASKAKVGIKDKPDFSDTEPYIEIPELGYYYQEEIASGKDIVQGNLEGKKVYWANKGDSVWKIAKRILAKSPKLKEEIKSQMKHPTEDGIIQVLTMAICDINKINYYADPQTLPKIGQKVNIQDKYLKEVEKELKDKSLNEVLDKAA